LTVILFLLRAPFNKGFFVFVHQILEDEMNSLFNGFPQFFYGQDLLTAGLVIIVDCPVDCATRIALASLRTVEGAPIVLLDAEQLNSLLTKQLFRLADQQSLVVFVGHGAQEISRRLVLNGHFSYVSVFAKRLWQPEENLVWLVGEILPQIMVMPQVKRVIVVDDVISSGQTLIKLCRRNSWKFPQAEWLALTWLSQMPKSGVLSGLKGYREVRTAAVVRSPQNRLVPINSLSTLLEDEKIAGDYAGRKFQEPEKFLEILGQIR
jgi:hypothetical protein